MKRAKLIKRDEIIERQNAASSADADASAPKTESPPSVVKMTFDAVRKWANERQSTKTVKPREAFDALFAEPRTNE
ncbi:MAG TPA: hypothetical protein VJ810_08305 [Blastocatellia bacterium]|nr:hypothetical protein [Blastocatellia bacterium]